MSFVHRPGDSLPGVDLPTREPSRLWMSLPYWLRETLSFVWFMRWYFVLFTLLSMAWATIDVFEPHPQCPTECR